MTDTEGTVTPPVRLIRDGTAACEIAGRRYKLRLPKVGEFRQIRTSYLSVNEEIADTREDYARRIADADGRYQALSAQEALTDEEFAERRDLRRQATKLTEEQRDRIEGLRFDWVREVFSILGDRDLPPEDDDLEPWLIDPGFQASLVTHWQTNPLARGGR